MADPVDRGIPSTAEEAERLLAELEESHSRKPRPDFRPSRAAVWVRVLAAGFTGVHGLPKELRHHKVILRCGDAYLKANGRLQVASYHNPEKAEPFAERLSRATGASCRLGERSRP